LLPGVVKVAGVEERFYEPKGGARLEVVDKLDESA
jgi:hypothetical protein